MKLTRTRTSVIGVSPEAVFDVLIDVGAAAARFPRPHRAVLGGIDPSPLATGSTVRWVDADTGMPVQTAIAIEVDRPRTLVFELRSGDGATVRIDGRMETRIEPLPDGRSQVQDTAHLEVSTFAGITITLFSPLMWWPQRRRRAEMARWIEERARATAR